MERETSDIICYLTVVLVNFTFIADLLGASWSAIKRKPYKGLLGEFFEKFADNPSLFWFPILVGVMYVYGLYVIGFFNY